MSMASSEVNSRASVQDADICVFLIKKNYGTITWSVEFQEALRDGKPFIILCDQETLQEYFTLKKNNLCSEEFRSIYDILNIIE